MSTRIRRVVKHKTPEPVVIEEISSEHAAIIVDKEHNNDHDVVEDSFPMKKKRKSPSKVAEQDRCGGKTTKGSQCTKKGSLEVNGKNYCHVHSPEKKKTETIMCQFFLKSDKNKQCSKPAKYQLETDDDTQQYCCKIHLPDNMRSTELVKTSPPKTAHNLICSGKKANKESCLAKSSFISVDGKKGYCRYHISQKEEEEEYTKTSPTKASSSKKAERPLCQGTTKARNPCKKYAVEGSDFCMFHK